MTEHTVMIVGAGPTGLMLAGELSLAGVDVAIVELRASQHLLGSRAGGLHARTIEALDQRGIANRFLSQGQKYPVVHFNRVALDISDFPTRHNYVLGLRQNHIERLLAEWVAELRVPIYRNHEVTGFTQNDTGIELSVVDGQRFRAEYLVGCDGGRSVIRKSAGIEFAGSDATTSWLIAEVQTAAEPKWGFTEDARGRHAIGRGDGGQVGIVLMEAHLQLGSEPTLRDVSEALVAIYGTDYGIHSPTWISRFTDMTRQATTYRAQRVLLAGDAAHVHPPMGGQGLNIGVQDAVNLGWKLAQVIKRKSSESLLDTYHAERFPIGARVLRNTMAQVALSRRDDRTQALAEIVAEFLKLDEPRKQLAAEISGLGIRYDCEHTNLNSKHPLLGRRMPDLDLINADGPLRTFRLLHHARPVLLNLDDSATLDIAGWADRVELINAKYEGSWELPAVGAVAAPSAVLIRPDGYVAWVGEHHTVGLTEALSTWFGAPAHTA
ncbi:MAG: FAD-dependent monooxygenase [Povalibacter sp.]